MDIQQKAYFPAKKMILYPIPPENGLFYIDFARNQLVRLRWNGHIVETVGKRGWSITHSYFVPHTKNNYPTIKAGKAMFIDKMPYFIKLTTVKNRPFYKEILSGAFGLIAEKQDIYSGFVKEKSKRIGREKLLVKEFNLSPGLYAWIQMTKIQRFTMPKEFGAAFILSAGRAYHLTSVTIGPSGKFAYVANLLSNDISVYAINRTTGTLTSVGTAEKTGQHLVSVTIDPSGKFAYVANLLFNDISVYAINQITGALTIVQAAVKTGLHPASVTIGPSGKFAYVDAVNLFSSVIPIYAINQITGALTIVQTVSEAGQHPASVTIGPSGKFAYVTNFFSNDISVYAINQITGGITRKRKE